jgi:salicylate hydroxylase
MTGQETFQVIIVGAGIGGLTLASICRRLSLTYTVLERLPELKPAGAAISLSPQALSVLDQLGLYGQLRAIAQPLTRIKISQNGTEWNELDWTICEKIYGYPVVTVERAKIMKILYAAAGEENVRLGTVVTDVVEDSEKHIVHVHLADGRSLSGSIVVGADGIRSAVRRALARETGNAKAGNTIKFTKRVHMSGWSHPMPGLGEQELGVANWLFYDDSVMMTYGGKDNRQWFIAIRESDEIPDSDRSVWVGVTPQMIKEVHGEKEHPFATKTGKLGESVFRHGHLEQH